MTSNNNSKSPPAREKDVKTYCRFCHAYCPMIAKVTDNQVTSIGPDPDNSIYGGYTCIKGRTLADQISHPTRLLTSRKKITDNKTATYEWQSIGSETVMDEVAKKLEEIIQRYGPRSVATYNGTYSYQNSAAQPVARAWHEAIRSPSFYSSVTIDQPAKVAVSPARMGFWNGGGHTFGDSDVALVIGNNTLVSHFSAPGGVPSFSPFAALRQGRKRGLKLICVDPRQTETATRADLHLQLKPGTDATLLAGLLHIIIEENRYDKKFCREHTSGLDALRKALRPFSPAYVSTQCGVNEQDVIEAAILFSTGPRGSAVTGTGPEMGVQPNLTEHLVHVLNAVCGRHYREGEKLTNPGVLAPAVPRPAQATGPQSAWLDGLKTRVDDSIRQLTILTPHGPMAEMPTAVLSDEILKSGDGQIKALICVGGNPLLAWPDQHKAHRALESLDLLVCVDIKMSATAELADYVIAPKHCLEREDVTLLTDSWYEQPYSQYTRAVIDSKDDTIEEWELFWGLAKRMKLSPELAGGPIPMKTKPIKLDLLKLITAGSRVPVEKMREKQGGQIYPEVEVIVSASDTETKEMLALFPVGLDQELRETLALNQQANNHKYPFLMISRRMKNTYNSTGPELDALSAKGTTNPAYINPIDLAKKGVNCGDIISIRTCHGELKAVAKASPDIREGVISMSHCWGGAPTEDNDSELLTIGSNTNRLINNRSNTETYSGMPQQSAFQVTFEPIEAPDSTHTEQATHLETETTLS